MRSIRRPLLQYRFEPVPNAIRGAVSVPPWLQFNSPAEGTRTAQAPGFALRSFPSVNQGRFEELGPDNVAGLYPGVRGLAMEKADVEQLANSSQIGSGGGWAIVTTLIAFPSAVPDPTGGFLASDVTAQSLAASITGTGIGGPNVKTASVWARQDGKLDGGFQFQSDADASTSPTFIPDHTWRRYSFTHNMTNWTLLPSKGPNAFKTMQLAYADLSDSLYLQSTVGPTVAAPTARGQDRLIVDGSAAAELFATGFFDVELVYFPLYASPGELTTQHNLFFVDVNNRVFLDTDYTLKMINGGAGGPAIGPIVLPRYQPLRVRAQSIFGKGRSLSLVQGTGPINTFTDATANAFVLGGPVYVCGSSVGGDGADQSCLLYDVAFYTPSDLG